MAPLADEAAGLTTEVLAAKLAEAEATTLGQRLPADVGLLERLRPALERRPASVAEGDSRWGKYLAYLTKRMAALRRAQEGAVPAKEVPRPPRTWRSYLRAFQDFARGVAYQGGQVERLRAEAALPRAQRTRFKDFEEPRIEQNVGMDTGEGLRFADALAIEQKVAPGQLPRVETISTKSRDFTGATLEQFEAQVLMDGKAAARYYGGMANIRRPSLNLRGKQVPISKVHLIYDAKLKPPQAILDKSRRMKKMADAGVKVWFE